MAARGRFVAFEGGEASGKSTQAQLLAAHLGAVLTREPGGTALGERLRQVVLEPTTMPIEPMAELLMMAAARAQHVAEVIIPALERGDDVVSDRFSGSTIAYQGYGRALERSSVEAACALGSGGLEPNLVVLLDVPEATAAARRSGREDRIEAAGPDFHERVRKGFLELASQRSASWVVLDGTAAVEDIAAAIRSAVAARLPMASGGKR